MHISSRIIQIAILLLCFFPVTSAAQTAKLLHGSSEISSNMINHIMQDKAGFIWISSDNGLNRLDGAKNSIIYPENKKGISFEQTFEDSKGRKWICASGRIHIYDEHTAKLKELQAYSLKGELMAPSAKGSIEDKKGNVYVYTQGNGLFVLEEKGSEMCFKQMPNISRWSFVYYATLDNKGVIWLASDKGLLRWDGKNVTNVLQGITQKRISTVCTDMDNNIWAGSDMGGLYNYSQSTRKASSIPELETTPIISLLSKRKGHLLAGSNGYGLFEVTTHDKKVSLFNFATTEINPRCINVHAVMNDNRGNLWIGCYQKGVCVLPNNLMPFEHIGPRSVNNNFIGNNCVMSMTFDSNGTLWVGLDGDGLYCINNGASHHFVPQQNHMPKTIVALTADKRGRLWIGSWIEGLWVMDLATQKMTPIAVPSSSNTPASVFDMVEDNMGRMWIATMGNGVFSVDMNTFEVKGIPNETKSSGGNTKRNNLPNRWVNCLCMGKNGNLYVGTFNGLGALNLKTGSCTSAFKGTNQLLQDHTIFSFNYQDDEHLWIGTSKGLMCLNTKTNKVEAYDDKDGVAGNCVQSIMRDNNGNIWIASNVGISRMDAKTGEFHNYFPGQGMFSNEFTKNTTTKGPDGKVYFGGTDGITVFSPNKISAKHEKPVLLISALYINGKNVVPATEIDGHTILNKDISNTDRICLPFSNRDFMIELSTLDFIQPENTIFEYRIDEKDWHTLPMTNNSISFSSLSPGSHKIEVRAKEWDTYSDVRELIVEICHPWYTSWWAWIIYLIIAAILAHAYIRYTKEKRKAQDAELLRKQQEDISEARLQSFMNISHEIRTPMTLIISPLQRLLNNDKDPKRQSAYQLMNRNAQRIQQLVNQLLDVRKIDKGQMKLYFRQVEMVSYVGKLVDSMIELCEVKNITLLYKCDESDLKAWIDPMNFDKIIYNLLSNAIKYSPENTTITVTLATTDEKHYALTVSDQGKGLKESEIEHVFDRFYQQHNATNNSVQGSGIGLNLTKSLSIMHHGDIVAANNTDGPGCHFIVTLPLGRDHITDDEIETAEVIVEQTADIKEEEETKTETVTAEVQETTRRQKTGKRMLIVEDDDEICHYIKEEFKEQFHITTCSNGEEALEQIRLHMPDIIISDYMMPVMDGMTLLKHVRQNTTMNEVSFIMLTAKTREEDNIEGLDAGADAYITKPFNIEILRKTAINLVQRHDQLRNIYNGNQTPNVENHVVVESPDEKLMHRIIKVINDNISNPALGNDLITKEVGISRVHLYRKLKELTNLSLRDYIKNIRLAEAARLLSEQKHNISTVAQSTGFENVSYFTVVFKQKYGISPSAYMESHRKKAEESEEKK